MLILYVSARLRLFILFNVYKLDISRCKGTTKIRNMQINLHKSKKSSNFVPKYTTLL